MEAGGVGEDGAGDELAGEDGARGGQVPEVGEQHHGRAPGRRQRGERVGCGGGVHLRRRGGAGRGISPASQSVNAQ